MGKTFSALEVSKDYGVSIETVRRWIDNGELKAVNVSRAANSRKPRWRITQAALDAFEAARTSGPSAPAPRRRKQVGDVVAFY
jgi:transposase